MNTTKLKDLQNDLEPESLEELVVLLQKKLENVQNEVNLLKNNRKKRLKGLELNICFVLICSNNL